jgi:NMD protein affecting ribosome stability and mRNA decay
MIMPQNCPRCGKLFMRLNAPICEPCIKEEDEIFEMVRLYIKENPGASITEVSAECEVPVKRIKQYIKDGKLDASEGMRGDITCSKCGRPILGGRMCGECVQAAGAQVVEMKAEAAASKSAYHTQNAKKR